MYTERASSVPGAVVWTRTAGSGVARVLPDGCMDVILCGDELLVAGPDTRAHLIAEPPGTHYVGMRFAPGTAPEVLGVPAHELRDQRVPLDALWPGPRVRRVAELMAERVAGGLGGRVAEGPDRELAGRMAEGAAGAADPGAVLEAVAAPYLRDTSGFPASAVAERLARGRTVAQVADAVGLGERQLRRRCLHAFGYGPKTLARVLRFTRALDLARGGTAFAEVAAVAGYADQAHLAREVRALAGTPLGELLR